MSRDPNAAFRARLNALALDTLICTLVFAPIGAIVVAILRVDGVPRSTFVGIVPSIVGSAIGQVLLASYCFAFEATRGRTPGKRRYHLRVSGAIGLPLTARQALIRNALRPIDALPGFYAFGLVSVLSTGRARRQRIGDIAAGTIVVLDDGDRLHTPGWLLPGLTFFAVVGSAALLVGATVPSPPAPTFRPPRPPVASSRGGPPRLGAWVAIEGPAAQYQGGVSGVRPPDAGRNWTVARQCDPAHRCRFTLTQHLTNGQSRTAPLVPTTQDWSATFPRLSAPCGNRDRTIVHGPLNSYWALWFTDHGQTANAREQISMPTPACGYVADDIQWRASHLILANP